MKMCIGQDGRESEKKLINRLTTNTTTTAATIMKNAD